MVLGHYSTFLTLASPKNYGHKLMHGVEKSKEINVGESKIGTILGKINPEAKTKKQNVANRS